jgi:Domain of unknown function (DUF4919)
MQLKSDLRASFTGRENPGMKNLSKFKVLICILALSAGFASAQTGAKPAVSKPNLDKSEYSAMVGRIKSGDPSVDFVKLRAAYLEWTNDECNRTDAPNREEMVKAFDAKDYAKAADLGVGVLDYEYTNRGLHLAVANAFKELKDADKEKYHTDMAAKLLKAMLDSGDGKAAKTAFKVQTIREEYVIMRELGYQVSMQSLVFDKEFGSFDVLTGKDKDGKEVSFYFDINSFFGGGASKPCSTKKK